MGGQGTAATSKPRGRLADRPGVFGETSNGQRVLRRVRLRRGGRCRTCSSARCSSEERREHEPQGLTETAPNGDRFIVLQKGRRYEGAPGDERVPGDRVRALCRAHRDREKRGRADAQDLPDARRCSSTRPREPRRAAVAHRRADVALVLVLLAIPMSFVNPRAGRSANLLFALFTYIVYSNLLSVEPGARRAGAPGLRVGWWLVHAAMVVLLVFMFARRMQSSGCSSGDAGAPDEYARPLPRAPDLQRDGVRAARLPRAVRLLRPDQRARRPRQGRLPPARRCSRSSCCRCRRTPTSCSRSRGADRHLYVLAQLAGNSEYTVMRGSGILAGAAAGSLGKIGAAFVVLTFVIGEWVAPAEEQAQKVKLRAMSSLIGQDLRIRAVVQGRGRVHQRARGAPDQPPLNGVRIYDFDADYRLRSISQATSARSTAANGVGALRTWCDAVRAEGPRPSATAELEWRSAVTPDMLDALIVRPSACRPGRCTSTPSTSRATGRGPSATRSRCGRSSLPARRARHDGARAALRLHAGPRRRGRREGLPRHHARHLLPHPEQPLLAHRACCRTGRRSPPPCVPSAAFLLAAWR